MTNDQKLELLQEIVEAIHKEPPPSSFTINEYVDMVRAKGGTISEDGARRQLLRLVEKGGLEGDKFKFPGGRRWCFWKPAKNPQ